MGSCCIGDCCIGEWIFDLFCSDSCCVGHSSSHQESEEHARKVAEELATVKENNEKISQKEEKKIMDMLTHSMTEFMAEIEKINNQSYFGERLNINIKSIREKNEQLSKQVVGCISNVLNKRLVQTDTELKVILAEKDDKKRKKNFDEFVNRVQNQAKSKLKIDIEKSVNAQTEVISKEIKTRQKEINTKLEESVYEMTEIMEVKKNSENELKKKQIDLMYKSSICEMILAEIER